MCLNMDGYLFNPNCAVPQVFADGRSQTLRGTNLEVFEYTTAPNQMKPILNRTCRTILVTRILCLSANVTPISPLG